LKKAIFWESPNSSREKFTEEKIKSYLTRDFSKKLVIYSIHVINTENPIIIKIFLKYRKRILGYGTEFNPPKKFFIIKHYRFLRASQSQNLYSSETRQFPTKNGSLREYYALKTNNPLEESPSPKEIDFSKIEFGTNTLSYPIPYP
jgi:hypothetical protein